MEKSSGFSALNVGEDQLDLADLVKDPKYSSKLVLESPEEATARRALETQRAAHKRLVNLIDLGFALLLVLLVFLGCLYEFKAGSVDDKKWAGTVLASIVGGFLGYVLRQQLD